MPLVNLPEPSDLVWIFGTITAALVLYGVRCRALFWYGLFEIVTSLVIMYVTFIPQKSFVLLNQGTSKVRNYLLTGIGILTGIYIFVRGMDNLDKALPVAWRNSWDRIFRGHRRL